MKRSANYKKRFKKPLTCVIFHNTLIMSIFAKKNGRVVKAPQFSNDLSHCWQGIETFPVSFVKSPLL